MVLEPRYWEAIILATDYSALETLDIKDCGFTQQQLELLVDHFTDNYRSPLPLKLLTVNNIRTEAVKAKLRLSAPNATITDGTIVEKI